MTSIRGDGLVEFSFYRAGVQEVIIRGNFSEVAPAGGDALSMTPRPGGWWVALVPLQAGEYRFYYTADGERYADYASHGVEFCKGQWVSVLVVPGVEDSEEWGVWGELSPAVCHEPREIILRAA